MTRKLHVSFLHRKRGKIKMHAMAIVLRKNNFSPISFFLVSLNKIAIHHFTRSLEYFIYHSMYFWVLNLSAIENIAEVDRYFG